MCGVDKKPAGMPSVKQRQTPGATSGEGTPRSPCAAGGRGTDRILRPVSCAELQGCSFCVPQRGNVTCTMVGYSELQPLRLPCSHNPSPMLLPVAPLKSHQSIEASNGSTAKSTPALVEYLGSSLRTDIAAPNHLCLQFQGIWCLLDCPGSALVWFADIHADKAPTHIK